MTDTHPSQVHAPDHLRHIGRAVGLWCRIRGDVLHPLLHLAGATPFVP